MRPRLVDLLETYITTGIADYLIPTGTMMYVLAMLTVMYVYAKRCERTGLTEYHALGTCIYAMIGGLAGARIFYLLETLPETLRNPTVILNVFGGTTSWGVYLGGFGGFFIYLIRHRLDALAYADVMGATLGLGPFIGRWSCFLHGCCYGTAAGLPWAVSYPPSSPLFRRQAVLDLIPSDALLSLPVHPLPVYLSLSALVVFLITSVVWKRCRHFRGTTFLTYWLLYSLLRFFLEYFRGNAARWGPGQWDLGQFICVLIVSISGTLLLGYSYKNRRKIA